jgi:hypothetical protein
MSLAKVPTIPALSWPVTIAIALNLIPVIGVLFWGWSAFALIFLYWLENLVVGVRTLVSMFASAAVLGGIGWLGALFFGAFFTVHYGLFCFIHGIFVMVLFGANTMVGESILDLAGAARTLFAEQSNLLIGFASIVGWQVVQFVLWLGRGEARTSNVMELMASPYPRIITLHVAIIFGGFLLMLLNQPIAGLVILTLAKMAYDVADAAKQTKPAAAADQA